MATSIQHDSAQAGYGATGSMFGKVADRYRRWSARRQQVSRVTLELRAYTDRQLADLGLCRSDIPDVARGHFRRA